MRKSVVFFLGALLLAACDKPLFSAYPHSLRSHAPRGDAALTPEETDSTAAVPGAPAVYATALCFPEGADWREGETDRAEVRLYRNGTLVQRVDAAADPERHRYRDGHLWTDRSDGAETVLFRDGEEYFRFRGEELFLGFAVEDRQVHSLGQRPGDSGFSYRIDGKETFSADAGTLLGGPSDYEWENGAFSEDLHYAYGIPLRDGEERRWEYKVMQGAVCVKTIPADASRTLFDLRCRDGILYRSERRSGGQLCIVSDENYRQLPLAQDGEIHLCKLVPAGDDMLVRGYSGSGGTRQFWLCGTDGKRFSAASASVSFLPYTDGAATAVAVLDAGGCVSDFRDMPEAYGIPPGRYRLATPRCCAFRDGFFAAALSHATDEGHLLLHGGTCDTLRFNGYFTSIQIR